MGPGTELKRLLHKFFITSTGVCKCNQRMLVMNEEGPDWCRENIDVIVGWLREEAENRSLPFSATAAKLLVRYAIRSAEKKQRMMNDD